MRRTNRSDDDFPLQQPLRLIWRIGAWRPVDFLDWYLTFELRPLARGFSIWSGQRNWREHAAMEARYYGISKKSALAECEAARWCRVARFRHTLTWRTAAGVLRRIRNESYGIHYQNVLLDEPCEPDSVSSELPPWLENLMALCAIADEDFTRFLLCLSEANLRRLWAVEGTLDTDWIRDLAYDASDERPSELRLTLLAGRVLLKGYYGKHRKDGRKDGSLPASEIERFLACHATSYLVDGNTLSEAFELHAPRCPELATRLLFSWIHERPPEQAWGLFDTERFLRWVLNHDMPRTLAIFRRKHPEEAERLVQLLHDELQQTAKELESSSQRNAWSDSDISRALRNLETAEFYREVLEASGGETPGSLRRVPPYWVVRRPGSSLAGGSEGEPLWTVEQQFTRAEDAIAFTKQWIEDFVNRPWPPGCPPRTLYDLFLVEVGQLSIRGPEKIQFSPMDYLLDRIGEATGAPGWRPDEETARQASG